MTNTLSTGIHVLSLLAGKWTGEGRGQYPTVQSFDYREALIFTRYNDTSLAYDQRTDKRYDGQTDWLVSHWERGFLRTLESGELELISAQSSRSEVVIGTVEMLPNLIRIRFTSKTVTNDPRMISTTRTFELKDDSLRYEMEMHTTKVDRLTPHLRITLQRMK